MMRSAPQRLPSKSTLILLGAGVTVTQVAEVAGVSRPYVSQVLSGRERFSDQVFAALVETAGGDIAIEVRERATELRQEREASS